MALPNREYWEMRSHQNILTSEDNALEIAKKVEKVYKLVFKDIENEINRFYARYAKQGEISLEEVQKRLNPSELRSFQSQAKEYYEYAKRNHWRGMYGKEALLLSAKAYMSRLEELKANILFVTQELYEEEIKLLGDGLGKQYSDSFNHTMYDYQTGLEVGVSFTQPNKEAIDSAIRQKWMGSNYSDRIWSNRDKLSEILQTEIPRMFALGENPKQAAKRMRDLYEPRFAERTYKDKNGQKKRLTSYCERVARTEFIETANRASLDAVEEMNQELGGDLFTEYEFVATLDGKTSEICQALDGKRFPVKEKKAGVNFPVMHPNCRSDHVIVIDGQRVGERIARDPGGKSYYVRGDMTYKEWWDSLTDDTKLQYQIAKNAKADAVQLKDYQKRLGVKSDLKSKVDFQRVKYYEPERWKELQGEYRRGKSTEGSDIRKAARARGQAAKNGEDQNIDKSVKVGSVDFKDKKAVERTLSVCQEQWKGIDHENSCIVTSDGAVWLTRGATASVNASDIEDSHGVSLKGSYSYHNHPDDQSYYSFSAADVGFFLERGLSVSKSSDSRFEYVMERLTTTADMGYDEIDQIFSTYHSTQIMELAMTENLDIDLDGYHETMKYLSEKYNFKYNRRALDV